MTQHHTGVTPSSNVTLTGPSIPGDDWPVIWGQDHWRPWRTGVVLPRVSLPGIGIQASFNEWALVHQRGGD